MSSKPPSCLIILTGLPKSNKSLVAKDILRRLLDAGEECVLVDEPSLSLKRNKAYKDARMEKITRQTLQSTVERYVRPNGPHVILDSMNLVKGFRYQLWCIARENACRCVTLFCADSREVATSRNQSAALKEVDASVEAYEDSIFEDLCNRYEVPDTRDRWHKPMFTLKTKPIASEDFSGEIYKGDYVSNSNDDGAHVFVDGEMTYDAIIRMVSGEGSSKDETTGDGDGEAMTSLEESFARNAAIDGASRKSLRPTFATAITRLSETNLRYSLDKAIQRVIDSIAKQNSANPLGVSDPTTYTFEDIHGQDCSTGLKPIRCVRQPTLIELRRFKRDFLKISSSLKTKSSEQISQLFAECVARDVK